MSQVERLYNFLKDGQPHRTDDILIEVYGGDHLGLARVGARIWDIKKKYPNIERIDGWKDKINPSLYWYKIIFKQPLGYKVLSVNGQVIKKIPVYN